MRSDDWALLIGRLAVALLYLPSGFGKLIGFSSFTAFLASKGLPLPEFWAALAILVEFGGSLLVLIGFEVRWAALALAAFNVVGAMLSHRYWTMPDAAAAAANRSHFYKDVALAGGFLFLYAAGPGRFSVDAWRSAAAMSPPSAVR